MRPYHARVQKETGVMGKAASFSEEKGAKFQYLPPSCYSLNISTSLLLFCLYVSLPGAYLY